MRIKPVPVFPRGASEIAIKHFGKITQVVKTAGQGNFRYAFIGGVKEAAAHFQAVGIQEINRCLL